MRSLYVYRVIALEERNRRNCHRLSSRLLKGFRPACRQGRYKVFQHPLAPSFAVVFQRAKVIPRQKDTGDWKRIPVIPRSFVIPVSYGSTKVIESAKWVFKSTNVFITASLPDLPCRKSHSPIPLLAGEERYDEALRALLKENLSPRVCGIVCFHPCEADCNRAPVWRICIDSFDGRYVSDVHRISFLILKHYGIRIPKGASVGAGPGRTLLRLLLSLLGHRATIFWEPKGTRGCDAWGIPGYRLPNLIY